MLIAIIYQALVICPTDEDFQMAIKTLSPILNNPEEIDIGLGYLLSIAQVLLSRAHACVQGVRSFLWKIKKFLRFKFLKNHRVHKISRCGEPFKKFDFSPFFLPFKS